MNGGDFGGWYQSEAAGVTAALGLALGDQALAEEATAEAFARAFANWGRISSMTSPVGWVYRVALNEARGCFRRRRLERRITQRAAAVHPPVEPEDALWEAVRALPERARLAIALRYVADLPESEVAALMGVARGTVAATLHQACRELAKALQGVRR